VSLDFLSLDVARAHAAGGAAVARSPMERLARAEGARFELRDGWNVAVGYRTEVEQEVQAARDGVGWGDMSHLGKLELQGPGESLGSIVAGVAGSPPPHLGTAARAAGAWWCPLTPTRVLVIADAAAVAPLRERLADAVDGVPQAGVVDVTTNFAALAVTGPQAREVLARFSALDLRPQRTPVGALRPGSIGRQPAILICEADNRYLFLFGWATAEYIWSVVADAGHHLGGRPIGTDALAALPGPVAREAANA
jgi:heterotetrameric sarcosine oxidase gamma subunit